MSLIFLSQVTHRTPALVAEAIVRAGPVIMMEEVRLNLAMTESEKKLKSSQPFSLTQQRTKKHKPLGKDEKRAAQSSRSKHELES